MLSKATMYVEDFPVPQPVESTTTVSLVKNHVITYIKASGRIASPRIISAGINITLMEIFSDSTLLTVQTLITGLWIMDGPTSWTQAEPHPSSVIQAYHDLTICL